MVTHDAMKLANAVCKNTKMGGAPDVLDEKIRFLQAGVLQYCYLSLSYQL